MKQSKTFIFLSLLVAVLALGVAYAALSQDLTIDAQATVAPDGSNFNVAFNGANVTAIVSGKETVTEAKKADIVTAATGVTTATLTVPQGILKTVDDYVEVEYTVKNSSKDLYAILGDISIVEDSEVNKDYVVFTAEYKNPVDKNLGITDGERETTVVVRATLVKSYVGTEEAPTITASADFTFKAEASETNPEA